MYRVRGVSAAGRTGVRSLYDSQLVRCARGARSRSLLPARREGLIAAYEPRPNRGTSAMKATFRLIAVPMIAVPMIAVTIAMLGITSPILACEPPPEQPAKKVTEKAAEKTPHAATDLAAHKPIAAIIAKADKVVLYEGLPHPMWETDTLAAEKKNKKTVEMKLFHFYADPIELKKDDAKEFAKLFSDPASLKEYTVGKRCGGFHPDWCIEWQAGDEKVQCQVCFGCNEVKLFSGKKSLHADATTKVMEKLEPALMKYQKQRPPHLRGQ
jgi:hypothetical protein